MSHHNIVTLHAIKFLSCAQILHMILHAEDMPDMTSPLTTNQGLVCCEYSRQAGEPLFATATVVDVCLLLEQPLPWGKEAFIESALPQSVKAHLSAALDTIPRSRLQFIRQPTRQRTQGITFFLVLSRELRSAVYRFYLALYEDIFDL